MRRGPRISLTAEGHALIEYADRMLGAAGEMVERFRTRDPLKGMLRLGLNESFALICLPELLRRLEQRYPAIRTSVFVGDTGPREPACSTRRSSTSRSCRSRPSRAREAGADRQERVRVVRQHRFRDAAARAVARRTCANTI